MLNELDKEITRRGHEFIRYADDCVILCKSRKSAERTLENLLPFIERKLFLKVNQEKTKLAHISQIKYLGYALYRSKGKYKLRIHPKSIAKMKGKVRVLTARSNGWSNEGRKDKINQFVRGWVQYFRLADMKGMLREIDKWVRNRIRLIEIVKKNAHPSSRKTAIDTSSRSRSGLGLIYGSLFKGRQISLIGSVAPFGVVV